MLYETGFHPGQEGLAAARVSSGVGDPGGVSYGAFQLSSHPSGPNGLSPVQDFLRHEGAQWASQLTGNPTARNGEFGTAWTATAQRQPDTFFDAQNGYIARTHFDPVVARVQRQTGLDMTSRSPAVQDVVWSMAVQHGAAPALVAEAVNGLKGVITSDDPGYDQALINKLYDVRTHYVATHHYPVSPNRYPNERRDALRMGAE
jgi:type VI secretion system secreted protein VgrG